MKRACGLPGQNPARIPRLEVDLSGPKKEGDLHDIRAILGNDVAIRAYREGKLPFPDGTIIAAVRHWRHLPLEENNKIFGRAQSFIAGAPDERSVYGQGFSQVRGDGGLGVRSFQRPRRKKSPRQEVLQTCFPCHNAIKARDPVFTRYAP